MIRQTLIYSILLVLGIAVCGADVIISEVFYDPAGADSSQEFVELYNDCDETVLLEGFSLESGNGAEDSDWTNEWDGAGEFIMPYGFFLIGEADVVPAPDHVTDHDLQNGPDAVRLLYNGTVADLVGYGEHEYACYFEAAPAEDVAEGFSLARILLEDTGNNSMDFSQAQPGPVSSDPTEDKVDIELEVVQTDIEGIMLSLPDEDLTSDGIQILPHPGKVRMVELAAEMPAIENITARSFFQGSEYEMECSSSTEALICKNYLPFPYSRPAGNYTVRVEAQAFGRDGSSNITFEYMPMAAFYIDAPKINGTGIPGSRIAVVGDTDSGTVKKASIKNIGNVELSVSVRSTALEKQNSSIPLPNAKLAMGTGYVVLSDAAQYLSSLGIDDTLGLDYEVDVPEATAPGRYASSLYITARSGE